MLDHDSNLKYQERSHAVMLKEIHSILHLPGLFSNRAFAVNKPRVPNIIDTCDTRSSFVRTFMTPEASECHAGPAPLQPSSMSLFSVKVDAAG
jgi:hypothetical protein